MNEEKKIITLIDEHGGRTEAEVVIAFKVDATGKEYIIYTKNESETVMLRYTFQLWKKLMV